MAVYSEDGTKLISYTYDAWGNFTTTYSNGGAATTATYNPFTYRGYYYDAELEFYYLNSRYYDSNTGRFINADIYINANGDILGFNMFAYCGNNPVFHIDDGGEGVKEILHWIFVKPLEAFFMSIEIEAGLGEGFGGDVFEQGITHYTDAVVGFDNGQFYTGHVAKSNVVSAEILGDTSILEKGSQFVANLSMEVTYMHYSELDGAYLRCTNDGHAYKRRTYLNVANCPHSIKTQSISVGPVSYNLSNNEISVGWSASAHLILGGHISVGFNISEYRRRLYE